MKYISFAIPSYNSEDYMSHAIESILPGGEDVEIIVVNDGSKDGTSEIAHEYKNKYPNIVRVVDKDNGGHGDAVNSGLSHATGKYFKVVDSDDWVDEYAYKELLSKIKNIDSDLIIMNYVYSYTDGRADQTINFSNVFKSEQEMNWDETGKWGITQYPSLHSMMYKKSVLDKTNINLPKHIFYEDNLFIYLPFVNTETIYYLNIDFYRYFIGRPDQSVQDAQLIKRSSHQVQVSRTVCNEYDLDTIKSKKLRKLMKRECIFLMTIGVVFSRMAYTSEGEKQYKELWKSVKEGNPKLYRQMRRFTMAFWVSLPGHIGRFFSITGYRLAHRLVKFN